MALANTTAAMFMAALDGSIVIIALPAIFRGIHLDPLAPGNISYLLWMIMGTGWSRPCSWSPWAAWATCSAGSRSTTPGFAVFTAASILLSFDPFQGSHGALWLIGWRVLQAVGGSMLMANSAAILTDAFPAERRGFALGTNQVAGLAGQFVGLVAGRPAGHDRLAGGVLGQRARRRVRHAVGLPQAPRQRRPATPAGSTGGATSRSRSA